MGLPAHDSKQQSIKWYALVIFSVVNTAVNNRPKGYMLFAVGPLVRATRHTWAAVLPADAAAASAAAVDNNRLAAVPYQIPVALLWALHALNSTGGAVHCCCPCALLESLRN